MKCRKHISMTKPIGVALGDWGVHQQAKKAFCTYKCTACQLAIFMLRELNLMQELGTKGC